MQRLAFSIWHQKVQMQTVLQDYDSERIFIYVLIWLQQILSVMNVKQLRRLYEQKGSLIEAPAEKVEERSQKSIKFNHNTLITNEDPAMKRHSANVSVTSECPPAKSIVEELEEKLKKKMMEQVIVMPLMQEFNKEIMDPIPEKFQDRQSLDMELILNSPQGKVEDKQSARYGIKGKFNVFQQETNDLLKVSTLKDQPKTKQQNNRVEFILNLIFDKQNSETVTPNNKQQQIPLVLPLTKHQNNQTPKANQIKQSFSHIQTILAQKQEPVTKPPQKFYTSVAPSRPSMIPIGNNQMMKQLQNRMLKKNAPKSQEITSQATNPNVIPKTNEVHEKNVAMTQSTTPRVKKKAKKFQGFEEL